MAKNIFFEEICDGVLCESADSFEDKAYSTSVVLNWVSLSICVLCCFYLRSVQSI